MRYEKILNQVESLQLYLMDINDYSEEVYQAFEKLIESLQDEIEVSD